MAKKIRNEGKSRNAKEGQNDKIRSSEKKGKGRYGKKVVISSLSSSNL